MKLETNEHHHYERLKKLDSKVFKDLETRVVDLEIHTGKRKNVRVHRQDETEGTG